ncbi:hypothetical protein [Pseudomonas huaxiensis]|uniref:hypothetical protein n=1 Tax=Pseudomonas huaxiensis TaxID=2213017 RepID=UPI0013002D0B|nr:hypothetical protein [Pseudomonas huaxiensis]
MSSVLSDISVDLGGLDIHALALEVFYRSDKSDEAGVARLIVKEDKIGEWKVWGSV